MEKKNATMTSFSLCDTCNDSLALLMKDILVLSIGDINHYRKYQQLHIFFKPAYFLVQRTQKFGQFWLFCRDNFWYTFYRPK